MLLSMRQARGKSLARHQANGHPSEKTPPPERRSGDSHRTLVNRTGHFGNPHGFKRVFWGAMERSQTGFVFLLLLASQASAFGPMGPRLVRSSSSRSLHMNLLGDLMQKKLVAQPPCPKALAPGLVKDTPQGLVLKEKLLSLSGEDFRVKDSSGSDVLRVDGTNVRLGDMVVDKLYMKDPATGREFCSVERRIVAGEIQNAFAPQFAPQRHWF